MNRTERMYAIVEELRRAAPGGRSSSWLARRFEVSARTIKRDMVALMDAGVPLQTEEGRGGGYRLARHAALPPLSFTPGEATAIAIAIAAEPELPFLLEARGALARLLGAMSPAQRREVRDLCGRVWTRAGGDGRGPSAQILDRAILERRVVLLDYVDASGTRTERRSVEPMAFARTHRHWHLLAWCRLREGGRWFRLDRVASATLTAERAPERGLEDVFGPPPDDARPVRIELDG
ncbi:MAG: WYL domain-containing protein [Alphaproteobacteria bacterium]|nr:WYL domain-containing protein [Alphaproteobacteria bacterium]